MWIPPPHRGVVRFWKSLGGEKTFRKNLPQLAFAAQIGHHTCGRILPVFLLRKINDWNDVSTHTGDEERRAWLRLREGAQGGRYEILSAVCLQPWPLAPNCDECPKKAF